MLGPVAFPFEHDPWDVYLRVPIRSYNYSRSPWFSIRVYTP